MGDSELNTFFTTDQQQLPIRAPRTLPLKQTEPFAVTRGNEMQGEKGANQSDLHLAMIGHELRNVLGGVLGLAELLSASGLDTKQLSLVQGLEKSAGQMRWLIESVGLDGALPRFPFVSEPTACHGIELLEQVIHCHTPAALEQQNLLLLSVEPAVPAWWHCDERLLRLILDNLLGNALKFNRSGEVELMVGYVANSAGEAAGLVIKIRDGGEGILVSERSRMFDPWVQLDGGSSAKGGAGIGLHVCQRMVSEMGGSISYSIDDSDGSCFKVCLPGVIARPGTERKPTVFSLLQSMVCLLSVEANVRSSLITVLTRLGVSRIYELENYVPDIEENSTRVVISETEQAQPGSPQGGGLYMTLEPSCCRGPEVSPSRWLSPPFLESSVGPLLMELALEYRMGQVADAWFNPDADETPDSTPTQR